MLTSSLMEDKPVSTLKAKQMTPSLHLFDSIVYTGKVSPKVAL